MTRKTGCAAGIFVGVLVFAAACARPAAIAGGTKEPPDSLTNPLAADQRAAALDYARQLKFDSLPHGAGDRQRLTTWDSIARRDVVGPLAQLLPERKARGNDLSALERGRIVGRVSSDGRYATLGLPAGISYLWIDSLRSTDYMGRAIVIPENPSEPAVRLDVLYLRDPHAAHGRDPAARWIYVSGHSELPWLSCVTNGCCVVGVRGREAITLDSED